MLKLIRARFPSKCKACGCSIRPGQSVYWAGKGSKGVTCVSCNNGKGEERQERSSSPTSVPPASCDGDSVYRQQWDGIGEVVADALSDDAANDSNRESLRQEEARHLSGDCSWALNRTRADLLDCIANPPAHLVDAVSAMAERIGETNPPTTPRRRRVRNREDGDTLDVDAWASRRPDGWDTFERAPVARKTVTIGINLAVAGDQRPAALLYRGVTAVALADRLIQSGISVELVALLSNDNPTRSVQSSVARIVVKRPDMPLDVGAVAFALADIGFVRCIAYPASLRHWPGKITSGWGRVVSLPPSDRAGIDYLIDSDVLSESSAVEWLQAQTMPELSAV